MYIVDAATDDGYRFVLFKLLFLTIVLSIFRRKQFPLVIVGIFVLFTIKSFIKDWFWTKYAVYPLWLFIIPLLDTTLRHKKFISCTIILVYLIWSLFFEYRTGVYTSFLMLAFLWANLPGYIMFIFMLLPLYKLIIGFLIYAADVNIFDYIVNTPSNIERYCMEQTGISNFFDHIKSGPLASLDSAIQMCTSLHGLNLYENPNGVDYHSFILTLWRDSGVLVVFIALVAYILFAFKTVRKINTFPSERSFLSALTVWPVFSFATGTPDMLTILICFSPFFYFFKLSNTSFASK